MTLTARDQRRAVALNRVLAGEWTQREAAVVLGLSVRQVRRVLARYQADGPAALVHGNRGRRPAHTLDPAPPTAPQLRARKANRPPPSRPSPRRPRRPTPGSGSQR